jgi:hypothetical protein
LVVRLNLARVWVVVPAFVAGRAQEHTFVQFPEESFYRTTGIDKREDGVVILTHDQVMELEDRRDLVPAAVMALGPSGGHQGLLGLDVR